MTTRVWFENDAIQMDGVGSVPARTLYTVQDGDRVHILTLSDVRLSQLLFGEYARKNGSGFASAADAKTYLDGEFAQSMTGVSDGQIQSAVDHALNDVPDFTVIFDSAST